MIELFHATVFVLESKCTVQLRVTKRLMQRPDRLYVAQRSTRDLTAAVNDLRQLIDKKTSIVVGSLPEDGPCLSPAHHLTNVQYAQPLLFLSDQIDGCLSRAPSESRRLSRGTLRWTPHATRHCLSTPPCPAPFVPTIAHDCHPPLHASRGLGAEGGEQVYAEIDNTFGAGSLEAVGHRGVGEPVS